MYKLLIIVIFFGFYGCAPMKSNQQVYHDVTLRTLTPIGKDTYTMSGARDELFKIGAEVCARKGFYLKPLSERKSGNNFYYEAEFILDFKCVPGSESEYSPYSQDKQISIDSNEKIDVNIKHR